MTILDYKGIEALSTVYKLQSFEAAAQRLYITQSAVSQRIKSLESYYGKPVITRTLPYRLSEMGQSLIGFYSRLSLLEGAFQQQIGKMEEKPRVSIAVNRDSLETWFFDLVEQTNIIQNIELEIVADDQDYTLDYLKNGLVTACLSTSEKEIQGGRVHYLGDMEYILVASPDFKKKYFLKGSPTKNLCNAPAIKFDQNDRLHERYLEKFFDLDGRDLSYHVIPSVQGFRKFAVLGYGYALIPKIDIVSELKSKQLIQLHRDKTWKIPLYWHYWAIESEVYQQFNQDIIQWARARLKNL